jgi:protein involved in temperature-dependent protein secretion
VTRTCSQLFFPAHCNPAARSAQQLQVYTTLVHCACMQHVLYRFTGCAMAGDVVTQSNAVKSVLFTPSWVACLLAVCQLISKNVAAAAEAAPRNNSPRNNRVRSKRSPSQTALASSGSG